MAGRMTSCPLGVILHGTRSGQSWDTAREYAGTLNYVQAGAAGLGWNTTIGHDRLGLHLPPDRWGWNARRHSRDLLAAELAQATVDSEITDGQVRAFCWWFAMVARQRWPNLPLHFPTHAELPDGQRDGKTDVFPQDDPRGGELRARILHRLETTYGIRS